MGAQPAKATEETTKNGTQRQAFSAETGRVLQLMIHSLYTNRDIFLRELISNASDACDRLRYQALAEPALLADAPELTIRLRLRPKERVLEITDNGIGMSQDELIANLGTIARSGTERFLREAGDEKADMNLIGQFGVGFYAAFMVAEKVEVISRRAGTDAAHRWVSDGVSGFEVEEYPHAAARGTSIRLHLKAGEDRYLDRHILSNIARTYSDHIGFPILLGEEGGAEEERVNRGAALWARAKTDVTAEQYAEFFRHVSHMPGSPWLTLHVAAEGTLSWRCLLFVPERRPFDLFHPDRRRRVKLYVKRVFITEEGVDLIPHYLRFVQGVIDSEDLPLNISRETLQANPVLTRIRESVEKKILQELRRKASAEPESYTAFWEQFGGVVKEGLCEAVAPKELILETCRFHSTAAHEALTGLEDYLARMKPGQEHIFYITGDSREVLAESPQMEGFLARGLEVLLLTDHVDDFWVNTVHEFRGKHFQSVTRAEVDLEKFPLLNPQAPDAKRQEETNDAAVALPEAFLPWAQSVLEGRVREVRLSKKLTESPACLTVHEGAMESRLETFLLEHKQLPSRALKLLELNPSHALIRALAARHAAGDTLSAEEGLLLLLDQAKILEGEPIENPRDFARRLAGCMAKSLE